MGLSSSNNSNTANPGVSKPVAFGTITPTVAANTPTNQLRGVAANQSTGPGIPKHVTNVSAMVANASKGTTSAVTVTFRRASGDTSFSGVNVYAKGYQSNGSYVQVGGGSDSPVTFVLNNTGEAVSLLVQARGNAGVAPLTTAPTTGVKLPKSTSGGYGTATVTTVTTGLTGDVITSGTSSPLNATVDGIQTVPVSATTPETGDILQYNAYGDSKWDLTNSMTRMYGVMVDLPPGASAANVNIGHTATLNTAGTVTTVNPTATEGVGLQYAGAATASTAVTAGIWITAGVGAAKWTLPTVRRWSTRVQLNTKTSARYWIGLCDHVGATLATGDTLAANYAAFRYSDGTDTTIHAVVGTGSGASSTVVDTGVAPDLTASHLFEIVYNGTAVLFFIDGVVKATISTHIPVGTTLYTWMITGDNKNTNNSATLTFQSLLVSLR